MQDIGRLDSPPIDSDTGARSHQGLRAIVTGGASGIGAAITAVLLDRGATVVVLDLQQSNALGVISVTCDVGNDDSVRAAVTTAVAHLGVLDILVNNAGIGAQGTVEDNADDEWRRVWEVNVLGTVRLSRACLPHLRRSGAPSIVNTSSIAATAGLPQRALYSATKGAIGALTRAMAADHVHEGIRVNAVNPGTADTPWVARLLADAADPAAERAALEARQPHGRLVAPEEIAEVVAYLTSPLARSTTGVDLAVDGGLQALRLRPA